MNAIETNQLSKFYGKSIGIENVSLIAEEGEIFGFIGPNGAGKSTFIRVLLGLIFPSNGSGNIFGKDIIKDSKKIKTMTGYLPAEVSYYYKMTALDLLEYSRRYYPASDRTRIDYLADALDLDLNMKICDMSLGNKKKVSIVQALLPRPALLILDEPTSGLDPLIQATLFDLLKEEHAKGSTIFFSSHVLSDVQKICSKVAIIQKGHIIKIEKMDTLRESLFKKVSLELSGNNKAPDFSAIGAIGIASENSSVSFMYNGDMNLLIKELSALSLQNLIIEEPTLEEIFLHYYRSTENNA